MTQSFSDFIKNIDPIEVRDLFLELSDNNIQNKYKQDIVSKIRKYSVLAEISAQLLDEELPKELRYELSGLMIGFYILTRLAEKEDAKIAINN